MRIARALSVVMMVSVAGAGCSGGGEIGYGGGGGSNGSGSGSGSGGSNGANGGGSGGANGGGGSGGANGGGGSGGANGGGGSGGANGGGGGTLVAIAGTYDLTTQFNLLDALPPDVKTALDLVLELGDSPGKFVLDMADKLPVIKYVIDAINLFSGIRDKIVMAIDEYINNWSGGMVTVMHDLSAQLEMALRGLSTHNKLVVGTPDASGNLSVDDTLVDITFHWNGKDYAYAQNAHATFTATASGLKVTLPAHAYNRGLDFGGVLVDLIDNVALPQLTGVSSLGALANQLVNCGGVSTWVWSYIGNTCIGNQCIYDYISSSDIAKLCTNALNAAGDAVESKLSSLTAPGMMSSGDGSCLAVENNGHTGNADTLSNGAWELVLPVASANLTLPGTFTGTRE
ncbi:MAG TPA: hypothetical protein VF334_14355 [Polyangia bacterium]